MSKIKTQYFCQSCGAQAAKWIGKCPQCGEWNTYVEEVLRKDTDNKWAKQNLLQQSSLPVRISEIKYDETLRIDSCNKELNRVLGGGIVPGSLILVGGEPGIGKSTLLLQVALHIKNKKILYVSGEESEQQIKMRAERIGSKNDNCYILTETSSLQIFNALEEIKPDFVIVDSIQTIQTNSVESSSGSVSQIRECTSELQRYAKSTGVPVFLIGHITKEGNLAGPKVLEHMVDCVLQFEGDRNHGYRILRSMKNRFGSTSELGIYEMQGSGLREVLNPSEILLSQRDELLSGTAIAATIEGARPILIETQALVSTAVYGVPQRSSTGFELRRLSMLLAVLEKRCNFKLSAKDVFLNIAGGIRVDDPAIDLAVISAILSSSQDTAINPKICLSGEIGLSGEIRPINKIEQRIAEADKLGFEKIIISKYNTKLLEHKKYQIEVIPVGNIENVFKILFL